MRARVVFGVFAVAVLAAGSAAAERKRVGVPRFDGPQEAVVRKAVMQVLKGDYDVVGSREIEAAAHSTGAQLDSNDGFKAVAKELSISSFVTGEVSKKKAKLTVRNGADGAVAGEGSFAGANPAKIAAEVRDGFGRRLGSAVDRGRAPSGAKKPAAPPVAEADEGGTDSGGGDEGAAAPAKPTPSARKPEKTDSAPPPSAEATEAKAPAGDSTEGVVTKKAPEPESTGAAGPRALDIAVGLRGFTRSLTYNDVLSQMDPRYALREYKLALGPAVGADVIVFPAAFATGGFAANIGAEIHLEQAFGVASNVPPSAAGGPFPMGATFPTVIHDFSLDARVRLPFDANEVSVSVGGGEQAFSFRTGDNGADRGALDIPDTIYRYLRIGADARFVLSSGLTLGFGGAYRQVLNKGGQISEPGFFPFLQVRGMDLNAKLGYQITPSIEGRFTFDLRRYGFAMNSAPADVDPTKSNPLNKVAGGAVDQYLGFTLGVAYVFGGVPQGAVSDEPAADEAPKKKKKKKKKGAEEDSDEGGGGGGGGGGEEGGDDSDQ